MVEKPNMFAIIPADVRYDKNLRANEKLLYGELTALTNKYGYCFASNNYFAELYGVTPQAISRWINNLKKQGYITIEYTYKIGTKEIDKRLIRLVSTKSSEVSTNDLGGYQQKVKGNNTSINNTFNNTYKEIEKEKEKANTSNAFIKDVIDHLNSKCNSHYKYTTPKTRQLIEARKKEGFTLDDFITVIDKKYDEWSNDSKMVIYLRPETLFGTKFESYLNQSAKKKISSVHFDTDYSGFEENW